MGSFSHSHCVTTASALKNNGKNKPDCVQVCGGKELELAALR